MNQGQFEIYQGEKRHISVMFSCFAGKSLFLSRSDRVVRENIRSCIKSAGNWSWAIIK